MGYDCTLHVVDPASIPRFVEWMLGGPAAHVERAVPDADALRARVLGFANSDPERARRALLELMLVFCSTETPHLPSRGLCVGLWHKLELGIAGEVPGELQDSDALTPLLAPLRERFRGLRFYTGIDQNYAVGHYVPPNKVPALRAHVEETARELPPSQQSALDALRTVLRVCEERGMAYWEGTDIAVANANASWLLENPARKKPNVAGRRTRPKVPEGIKVCAVQGARMPTLCFEQNGIGVMSCLSETATYFVDVHRGVTKLLANLHIGAVVRDGDGRTLAVGRKKGENTSGLYSLDLSEGRAEPIASPLADPNDLAEIDGRVLVLPSSPSAYHERAKPTWLDGTAVNLPAEENCAAACAFAFGDGSALLFLREGEVAYRIQGRHAQPLPVPPSKLYLLNHAAQGAVTDDGAILLALADSPPKENNVVRLGEAPPPRLVTISPEGECRDVMPEIAHAYPAWPGPDDAVVIQQMDPIERDVLKVYFHRSGEVTSIPQSWSRDKTPSSEALYAASSDELWISYRTKIVVIPWNAIAELPRQSHLEFKAAHEQLVESARQKAHAKKWKAIRGKAFAYAFDSNSLLLCDSVIEHPELGRGIVVTQDLSSPEYEAEFEDGAVHTFARVKRL